MKSAAKFIVPAALFVVTVILVNFILGLVFQSKKEPDPIFLKVVGFWDPKVFNGLKKQFQEQNPRVTIEYEQKDPTRYYPNLKADLATSKTPDVFWWHSGWGTELGNYLDHLPATILSSTDYEKIYYPITKTDMKVNGSYRGLPLEFDGLALFYNKALFASANFSETPKTWLTLRQNYVKALTLRDKTRIFTSAIALGSVVNVENYPEIMGLFLLQSGIPLNEKKDLAFYNQADKNAVLKALDSFNEFYQFSTTDKTWDSTLPNSIEAFAKGKVAMILLPANKIGQLQAAIKKENIKLNFGIDPVPQLPGTEPVSWGSYWALGVSKKSLEKEASWKLVKFLSEPDSLRAFYKADLAQNNIGRAYPRVDMAKEQTTNQYLAAYLTQASYAKSWFFNSDTHDGALNDAIVASLKEAMTTIETGRSGSTALKKFATDLKPILKKYGVEPN